ncbi:hypothetical protein LTR37_006768 [Vermiconidia calcicola]|uniref:Uncharacterized protein n=1 Tax=Vermiconidia calcicola TaxID=1690605 RepID=A0ACC3NG98_9PEZI|nr:hypothetical protein LTR37_006768 [Vermiconidia calcicola]
MVLKTCCATGSLHTGNPTGRIENVHGLDCYIADAPNGTPNGIVVIIPDAFGWTLPNNRILADCYAKEGNFQVYLPEFMNGFKLPADLLDSVKAFSATGFWNQIAKVGHAAYLLRHFLPFMILCRPAVTGPRVYSFMKALKQDEAKDLHIGTAGFCWGGYFVTKLCADMTENRTDDGKRVTVCGFVAHPSMLTYPTDIEGVQLPYSCAAAGEKDPQMSAEQAKQTEEILKQKTEKKMDEGIEHEFVMYPGAHHGFAVRADENDKDEAEKGKQAESQAVKWFTRWFANPPP